MAGFCFFTTIADATHNYHKLFHLNADYQHCTFTAQCKSVIIIFYVCWIQKYV